MTEKRYYKHDCEEAYYVFDSKTLSESEFEEKVEYYGYNVFADSLTGEEVVDLLNENEQLKSTINTLTHDNTKMKKVLNTTKKENEHIKNTIKEAYQTERTHIGKNTLKQLLEAIQ